MRRLVAFTLFAAACGGKSNPAAGTNTPACPSADVVRYAIWQAPTDGGQTYGAPATGHWTVPVGYRFEDQAPPPAGPITRDAVVALGMLDVPDVVWLYDGARPACKARVTGFIAVPEDHGMGISTTVSAVTEDCAPSGETREAWILAVPTEPVGCGFAPAAPLASHTLDEKDGQYAIPATKQSIPPPLDLAVQRPACAPSCPTLWSLRSVESSPRVTEMTVTHIVDAGELDDPCNWEWNDQFGIYLGGGPGVAPKELRVPPPPEDDYVETVSLAGAFVDGTGPRIVALLDVAVWGAYSITADATLDAGQRVRYYRNHEEDFWYRSLAPYCGP